MRPCMSCLLAFLQNVLQTRCLPPTRVFLSLIPLREDLNSICRDVDQDIEACHLGVDFPRR
jgi:hypothetical protein